MNDEQFNKYEYKRAYLAELDAIEKYQRIEMELLQDDKYTPSNRARHKAAFWGGFCKGAIQGAVFSCKCIAVVGVVYLSVKFFII